MGLNMSDAPRKTVSGIFIRKEKEFGLIAYSPKTGLIFAVHSSQSNDVTKWLDNPSAPSPSEVYRLSLGAGWATDFQNAKFPRPHLLPDETMWPIVPSLRNPLLINWLITGRCPLSCKYCYAEDLMRKEDWEPDKSDIRRIAESILALKPLAIVLTGGDPLFSPYLEDAIHIINGRAGIIVDTSGYTFGQKHLELFKEYDVVVRISLDSERPKRNQIVRYLHSKYVKSAKEVKTTGQAALDAILKSLDFGLPIVVQTVATKKNASELVAFGDKLYKLGVHSWRIFEVAYSWIKSDEYERLVGPVTDEGKRIKGRKPGGPYPFIFKEIHKASIQNWRQSIAVQTTFNSSQNAVILVAPDGKFYTASNINGKKVIIDESHPTSPSIEAINRIVEMQSHVKRYLNVTGPGKETE